MAVTAPAQAPRLHTSASHHGEFPFSVRKLVRRLACDPDWTLRCEKLVKLSCVKLVKLSCVKLVKLRCVKLVKLSLPDSRARTHN